MRSNVEEKQIDMDSEPPLKLTYKTDNDNATIDIHVLSVFPDIANYAVDCDGDGVFEKQYEGTIATCRYSKKGMHQIALIGRIPSIRLSDGDGYSLLSVDQWGTNRWRSTPYQEYTLRFRDCRWELVERKTQEQLAKETIPDVLFRLYLV